MTEMRWVIKGGRVTKVAWFPRVAWVYIRGCNPQLETLAGMHSHPEQWAIANRAKHSRPLSSHTKTHHTQTHSPLPQADWERALRTSTTLYIGNLSFYTREEQIYEVFSKCGAIEKIVMGLDKVNKTPCGFAFVVFYTRCAARGADTIY